MRLWGQKSGQKRTVKEKRKTMMQNEDQNEKKVK